MRLHNGFSLLEILVAFAIMAVSLTIILRIFGSGINSAVVSEDYTMAVQIAESLMARTGIETPLEVGEFSGTEGDKYHWTVSVNPLPALVASQPDQGGDALALMAINVFVSWGDGQDKNRILELESQRLFRRTLQ